jgi:cytochrome b561
MTVTSEGLAALRDAPGARYSAVQIALHWLVVLLIAEQYVTSAAILRTHAYRPLGKGPDPFDMTLHTVHTRVGLAIFALVVLRLVFRLARGTPSWRSLLPLWRTRLSSAVQYALYLVLLAEAAAGAIASYLWWPMSVVHQALFWMLLGLVAMHLGGAALSFAARPRETLFRITGMQSTRP